MLGLHCHVGFPLVTGNRVYSPVMVQGLLTAVSSLAPGLSRCRSWAPECRVRSYGSQAWPLCSMWDLPRPGIEPRPPALAGGFFTTGPPGEPKHISSLKKKKLFPSLPFNKWSKSWLLGIRGFVPGSGLYTLHIDAFSHWTLIAPLCFPQKQQLSLSD